MSEDQERDGLSPSVWMHGASVFLMVLAAEALLIGYGDGAIVAALFAIWAILVAIFLQDQP